ncbi:MAG: MarR family transcriptional regulator [Burkholderiales bacterium]|nr:MarR family transcriptional regulator [Burkholderiales bacterium]
MQDKKQDDEARVDIEVLKQFRVIFKSVRKHFQAIEDACGVSGAQLWALSRIAAEPGLRVSDLARGLAIHQSTASNLIEKLVEQGLVSRERSSRDQRVVHLSISSLGETVLGRAPGPFQGLLPDALSKLSPAQLDALHESLDVLLKLMADIEPGAVHMLLGEM